MWKNDRISFWIGFFHALVGVWYTGHDFFIFEWQCGINDRISQGLYVFLCEGGKRILLSIEQYFSMFS